MTLGHVLLGCKDSFWFSVKGLFRSTYFRGTAIPRHLERGGHLAGGLNRGRVTRPKWIRQSRNGKRLGSGSAPRNMFGGSDSTERG
jgi:hypothetical protein